MKKINIQTQRKYRTLGLRLFILGLALIALSTLINLLFIHPTNFKQQYKDKRYKSCLERYDNAACSKLKD